MCFLRHLGFETAALFVRVGQLAEAVRQFHAATIQLEAFGEARIVGRCAGERGFDAGVAVENRDLSHTQTRFDALGQHAAENVGPGIIPTRS